MPLDLFFSHPGEKGGKQVSLLHQPYESEMESYALCRVPQRPLEALPLIASVEETRENSLRGVLLILLFA